jgi:hypothetical protein
MLTRGYVRWADTRNGNEANILEIAPRAWGSPASRLTPVLLSGHADASGQPRVRLDDASRERILAWMDLNVPYYGTYEMDDPNAEGGRRVYPPDFDAALAEVAKRRCASCHQGQPPSCGFVRISEPALNDFLVAPLAKAAGGRESCGRPVFATKDDADYQALLKRLASLTARLAARPRMDMPGAVPAPANRSCQ